jgi:hypothetical protein
MTTEDPPLEDGHVARVPTEQHAAAYDRAQQVIAGPGSTVNASFGGHVSTQAETKMTLAPPLGLRDERFPLRGRADLVDDLLDKWTGVHVLYGMGGCGKTSIALEVAARASIEDVWWVSAAQADEFQAGMRALARRLGLIDEELRQGDLSDLVWQRLARRTEHWLLVIDNADDPPTLADGQEVRNGTGWLRPQPGNAGLVIVTSRDGHRSTWGSWCRLRPVGVLASDQATQVLLDHAGDRAGSRDEAAALAERLGGLPLALRLAGSYLAEALAVPTAYADPATIRTYTGYLQAVEDGDFERAFPDPGSELSQERARGLIGRTWELSLDQLAARDMPEARSLLHLLAAFADAPIPHTLLLRPGILAESDLFPGMTGPRLWKVLQALAAVGLIDFVESTDGAEGVEMLRLHPLVRDTGRLSGHDEIRGYLVLTADLVHKAAVITVETGMPEDPARWPLWQALTPHAFHLLDLALPDSKSATLTGRETDIAYCAWLAARYLRARASYSQALGRLEQVLALDRHVHGDDHPDTLAARHEVARVMAEQGRYAGAEALYREVQEVKTHVLGDEHPSTLATKRALNDLLGRQNAAS